MTIKTTLILVTTADEAVWQRRQEQAFQRLVQANLSNLEVQNGRTESVRSEGAERDC